MIPIFRITLCVFFVSSCQSRSPLYRVVSAPKASIVPVPNALVEGAGLEIPNNKNKITDFESEDLPQYRSTLQGGDERERSDDEVSRLIAQVDAHLSRGGYFTADDAIDEGYDTDDRSYTPENMASVARKHIDGEPSQGGSDNFRDRKKRTPVDSNRLPSRSVSASVVIEQKAVQVPSEINARVKKWIKYFSEKDHERFQRFLNRGAKYRARILEILADNEVPEELYYLAMIESGFTITAKSHASAVGVWQFISATGKRYGLKRNYYTDERHDPFRATMAAAAYLKDLHRVFDSWYLAMAGYNAGEMRILRSIMKSNSRDFWELARKKSLPRETMNYVPKFLAATIIGRNPERFGFHISAEEVIPQIALVDVPSPISLKKVAKIVGIPIKQLKMLNPHLRRGITPPSSGRYGVWVPAEREEDVRSGYKRLAKHKIKNYRRGRSAVASNIKYHRVRRGENLTLIAKRYHLPVWKLRRLNGLKSSSIHPGDRLKVQGGKLRQSKKRVRKYRVRRGDNLSKIARKFGVSVKQLKKSNKIRRSHIWAGQVLKIASR